MTLLPTYFTSMPILWEAWGLMRIYVLRKKWGSICCFCASSCAPWLVFVIALQWNPSYLFDTIQPQFTISSAPPVRHMTGKLLFVKFQSKKFKHSYLHCFVTVCEWISFWRVSQSNPRSQAKRFDRILWSMLLLLHEFFRQWTFTLCLMINWILSANGFNAVLTCANKSLVSALNFKREAFNVSVKACYISFP